MLAEVARLGRIDKVLLIDMVVMCPSGKDREQSVPLLRLPCLPNDGIVLKIDATRDATVFGSGWLALQKRGNWYRPGYQIEKRSSTRELTVIVCPRYLNCNVLKSGEASSRALNGETRQIVEQFGTYENEGRSSIGTNREPRRMTMPERNSKT